MEITSILKLISLLVAAGFAILGTTVDYKKEGLVTKWGRIAIIGVIVSGLLSVMLLGIEESSKAYERKKADVEKAESERQTNEEKAELNKKFGEIVNKATENIEKTKENLDRTTLISQDVKDSVNNQQQLMSQTKTLSSGVTQSLGQQNDILSRTRNQLSLQLKTFAKTEELQSEQERILRNTFSLAHPLKGLYVSYILKFPGDDPVFSGFVKKIKTLAENLPRGTEGFKVQRSGSTGMLLSIDNPAFFPSEEIDDERVAASLVNQSYLFVDIFKDVDFMPGEKPDTFYVEADPDLRFSIVSTNSSEKINTFVKNWGIKNNNISQSVELTVGFPKDPAKAPAVYLDVTTNVIDIWEVHRDEFSSLLDLHDATVGVTIPCGSDLFWFQIKGGDSYYDTPYIASSDYLTQGTEKPRLEENQLCRAFKKIG